MSTIFKISIFLFCTLSVQAQKDTTSHFQNYVVEDSVKPNSDSVFSQTNKDSFNFVSNYFLDKNKTHVYDIENVINRKNKLWIFYAIICGLGFLTFIKISYSKDFTDTFMVLVNTNNAAQIFRTKHDDFGLSSILLIANFILMMAVMTQFIMIKYISNFNTSPEVLLVKIIFLFTFFIVLKIVVMKFIGSIFDVQIFVNEYLFNVSQIVKVVGIALIPIVCLIYISPENTFYIWLTMGAIVVFAMVLMILLRGLSTCAKLMYKSLYHFLIYFCVVEMLPVFLLIKFLTKTAV